MEVWVAYRVFSGRVFGCDGYGALDRSEGEMNPEYYRAYSKWMCEFLHKWDYTILMIVIGAFALIGFGTVCWLFKEWLFNSIGE